MTLSPPTSDVLHGNSAYHALIEDIRSGTLQPGDRLRETELAKRLKVSRTPVREAIRLLEADGLVTHLPRIGATVRTLEYAEVMELYEMRAVLEATAARLAARSASAIELEDLSEIQEQLTNATDASTAFHLNRLFHAAMLDAAKNRFLHKSMISLQKALMILGPTTLAENDRFERAIVEHQAILSALHARDEATAETHMRTHIEASQKARIRNLRLAQTSPQHIVEVP
ncbi:MAG: GntR family transcriptional regulator [Planktomarina sp.]